MVINIIKMIINNYVLLLKIFNIVLLNMFLVC